MWAWLKAAGPASLPFEIGEASTCQPDPYWSLHRGKRKADNAEVSIFSFDTKTAPNSLKVAKNALKRFKTLRHPNFVKFIDSHETDSSVIIVTEPVTPLLLHLQQFEQQDESMQQTRQQFDLETKWGLHQVLKGLAFLNNDCKLVHNSISLGSIFVDQAGEWKIGGLDYVCAPGSEEVAQLLLAMPREKARYMAPEVRTHGLNSNLPPWTPDMWSLGVVIMEAFNHDRIGRDFSPEDLSRSGGKTPQGLLVFYRDMVSTNPRQRPDPARVMEVGRGHKGYFEGSFVDTCLFLEQIQLKDADEKTAFFKKLPTLIEQYPPRFQKYKILPELVKALMYGGAAASYVLSPVLHIGKLLSTEEYAEHIVPCVIKLFSANDRATRMSLLQQLDLFAEQLRENVINDTVFPQIAQGFTDTLPAMREASVKASLYLAPKLTDRTVNNILLRHFARLQVDPEPGIRTNTTICLGKMAVHFTEATRKKVLAVAFSRALRDPFMHARISGIMAFVATQEFYDAETVATKIIPALAPLGIDPEGEVRTQAFKALTSFIQRLQKHANEMPQTAQAPAQGQNVQGSGLKMASLDGGAAVSGKQGEGSGGGSGGDSGWAGWAMTSAMSSLAKVVTVAKDAPLGNINSPTPGASGTATTATNSTSQTHNQTPSAMRLQAPVLSGKDGAGAGGMGVGMSMGVGAGAGNIGGGDGGGWEQEEEGGWDNDEWESIEPTQQKTANATTSHGARASQGNDSGSGWGNDNWDDDDGFTPASAPAPAPARGSRGSVGRTSDPSLGARKVSSEPRGAMVLGAKQSAGEKPLPPGLLPGNATLGGFGGPSVGGLNMGANSSSGMSGQSAGWSAGAGAGTGVGVGGAGVGGSKKNSGGLQATESSGWDDGDDGWGNNAWGDKGGSGGSGGGQVDREALRRKQEERKAERAKKLAEAKAKRESGSAAAGGGKLGAVKKS